jgi:hypothetical protein
VSARVPHLLAVPIALLSLAAAAHADCPPPPESVTCPGGAQGQLIDYVFIEDPPISDTRASFTDCGHEVRLRGWWFTPPPPTELDRKHRFKGFPLVVYSHGSEDMKSASKQSSAKCAIVDPLVAKGMAVFVPHRRGHGKSTGVYYESYQASRSVVDCANDPVNCRVYQREAAMSYLHDQALDIQLAALVAKQLPNVDQQKVSLMGHSFGAMTTMFANEIDVGQKAVINFAGGGESWDGDPCKRDRDTCGEDGDLPPLCRDYESGVLQDYLYGAVDKAKAPVFSFDTNHDVSVAPVYELPYRAWSRYRNRWQATLYGPVSGLSCKFPDSDGATVSCDPDEGPLKLCPPDPVTGEQDRCGNVAHSAFATQPDQIARWMPSVLEFLKRHGAR